MYSLVYLISFPLNEIFVAKINKKRPVYWKFSSKDKKYVNMILYKENSLLIEIV